MPGPDTIVRKLLESNPRIAGDPNSKAIADVILSGDAAKANVLVDNYLKSLGMTREEALRQAKGFLGIPQG